MGARVTRVATDGDRKFTTLPGGRWEALQVPGDWVFDMPVMGQDRVIDAAGRYPVLDIELLPPLAQDIAVPCSRQRHFGLAVSPDCRLTFTSEVWVAIHFSDASLRNEAAKLGVGVLSGRRPLRHSRSKSSRCLSSLSSIGASLAQFVAVFSGQCQPSTCFLWRGAGAALG
jgi:hypothetical protein